MPDRGHELTDELLSKLERRIAREYRTANKEAAAKLQAYLEEDEAKRKVQESLLKAGKITQKDFNNWVFRHKMMGKRWEEMRDVLAQDYHNANKIALNIAKGRMPDVYALNCNFATYQIEHDAEIDTGFTLYNHDTAEYLLSEERTLMPGPSTRKQREIAQNKDMQWNRNKIQSAVLQGILQGESPYDVAKRLQNVGQMNYNAAVRYARTMTTNAQNAGRYQAFRRADQIGVDLTIEWQATLDGRTRHEHRMMHGQRRGVGEPFEIEGVKILWPAQVNYDGTNLPQELIWNCRCTLLSLVKGFEGDTVKTSPKMGEMSFEEWQHEKEKLKTVNQLTASPLTAEERAAQLNASALIKDLRASKIARLEPTRYDTMPTDEDIIAKVSGGDETKGSCVSLSFAYAGNKNGLEVLDFRGGESQSFFSSYYGWKDIAKRFGISEKAKTEIVSATNLVKKAEDGKQYILIAGKHAAVVRRNPNKDSKNLFEYLELQDQNGGWYGIGANTFKDRFGCRKTARRNLLNNEIIEAESYLIDIASLNNDAVFEEVLAYINTEPTKQKKGRYGYAK